MLTDSTRRDLQQLRFLLEEALARSRQQAEIDRRAAILLLDGACEYAMALALGHRSLQIAEAFAQKYSDLRKHVREWQPDTWTSIRQLHEARNLAQHHGALADPGLMPTWAAQTHRFVTSLVKAVFELELETVLVAEAVEGEEIRGLLVEGERALAREEAAAAFDAAVASFDAARRIWQDQRAEAIDHVSLQFAGLSSLVSGPEIDPLNRSLLRFEDILEVQPFAPDIAEYLWLLSRTQERSDGMEPTLETARRAFTFVLAWVLRWEAFALGYEARKYPPPTPPYEPPVTGAEHPVVYAADVERQHHVGDWGDDPDLDNVRYAVRIALADVPERDRELWAAQVSDVLNEIVDEHGSEYASGAGVSHAGIVRFHAVTAKASARDLLGWLAKALAEGNARYREELTEKDALSARLPLLRDRLQQAVSSVDDASLTAPPIWEEREGSGIRLGVPIRIDDSDDEMLLQVLQDAAHEVIGGRPDVRFFNNTLWFGLEEDAEAAAEIVAATLAGYAERAARRAAGRAAVEKQRQKLESELRQPTTRLTRPERR